MKKLLAGAVTATALLVGASGALPASAAPAPSGPEYIIGGTQAPATSWMVQLRFTSQGKTYGCSGEAIAPQWVLTARHCIDKARNMKVYFSNSTSSLGTPVAGDRLLAAPTGDVALIHLQTPKTLNTYPTLTSGYTPANGDPGVIMGYGARANSAPSTGLFQANVTVTGASTDAFRGPAVHVVGVDGASNHGDSGGPLLVGGVIVGVCSTGDVADPGANIHAGSNYANISGVRSWIRTTAGV